MDITKFILNFRTLIPSIHDSLDSIGLERGGDSWDQLTELAFRVLVTDPVEEASGKNVDTLYEAMPEYGSGSHIQVEVSAGANILTAPHIDMSASPLSTLVYHYSETKNIEKHIKFTFVEFDHPFHEYNDIAKHLDYVHGVAEDGLQICASLQDCRFYINS